MMGYIAIILMGILLGLMGSGGSILTVPILVYIFKLDPLLAISYSLFIVGITSLIGAFHHFKEHNIHFKSLLLLGIPSIISVYAMRLYVMRFIPEIIFQYQSFTLTKHLASLLLFSLLMILSAYFLLRKKSNRDDHKPILKYNYPLLFIAGIGLGLLTGLLGAGGGFLIIPALLLCTTLNVKQAVGNSLLLITFNALNGFIGDLQLGIYLDWDFLLSLSGLSIMGIFIGFYLSTFISNEKIKPIFAGFLITMGIFIMMKELFLK